jgi:hypothetical protein
VTVVLHTWLVGRWRDTAAQRVSPVGLHALKRLDLSHTNVSSDGLAHLVRRVRLGDVRVVRWLSLADRAQNNGLVSLEQLLLKNCALLVTGKDSRTYVEGGTMSVMFACDLTVCARARA